MCISACSSTEVEYTVVGVSKLLQLKSLMSDIGIPIIMPMKMYCGKKVAKNLMNNAVLYDMMKHVKIDHHFTMR